MLRAALFQRSDVAGDEPGLEHEHQAGGNEQNVRRQIVRVRDGDEAQERRVQRPKDGPDGPGPIKGKARHLVKATARAQSVRISTA